MDMNENTIKNKSKEVKVKVPKGDKKYSLSMEEIYLKEKTNG